MKHLPAPDPPRAERACWNKLAPAGRRSRRLFQHARLVLNQGAKDGEKKSLLPNTVAPGSDLHRPKAGGSRFARPPANLGDPSGILEKSIPNPP